ncbi:MAG TPA: DUF1360 domain-containing protein [Bacillus bacterium]|uniref:Membrane protein n=1 Tax=Siminovitchia fordii TaxID=254759 RepID=A0ABQ4K0B0_9BACI|nr:DUF1360 domain-containing protein [Siminovitchia fordii]GIN19209.1 membrane protein [Siminovitchia fordii]HBZ10189.1 DUF1360 domain-containing protein [Bacillus sp. (in: firmicutes)]
MDISWLEYIIFSMAVFRLTRLLVYDQITEWIRSPFMDEYEEKNDEGKTEVYLLPKEEGLRGWMGALLSCFWCTGIWVSIGLFLMRYYIPVLYKPVVIVLAVAGLAALVETWIQSKNIE